LTIAPGSRLGPYEILAPLGAGGMGEVWRARDTRLAREVAIKVLPAELSTDAERLRRFEREARAASALSHPNIVTIYEVGREDSVSFIVMELVEGKTLRALMAEGPPPPRRLLSVASQVAEGLTRAHEAGIVHRDLKPENVMVTRDGLVKILDFGLAKLTNPEHDSGQTGSAMTVSAGTRPGIAMGTAAYMSPEQAGGHPVDFRSDQFSLGTVLYEMGTGRSAFKRGTLAQTLAAIIDEEPEPLSAAAPRLPAPVRWVIERCLAKEPAHRYAATRDLARDLAMLRERLSEASGSLALAEAPPRRRQVARVGWAAAILAVALAGLWLGSFIQRSRVPEARFQQLTFRGGGIGSARFTPDGQTVVFSAETEGRPPELLSMRVDGPEARSLGLPPAQVLSISSSGSMAVLLLKPYALSPRIGHMDDQVTSRDPHLLEGILAEASLAGGAARELLDDVVFADWAPNGSDLAVVHRVGNRARVEYPIGTVLYDSEAELVNHLRFSARSGTLAFKDWEKLFVVGASGGNRLLSGPEQQALEIVWPPRDDEVWSNELNPGETLIHGNRSRVRLVASLPGDFVLFDASRDGGVLLGRLLESSEIIETTVDDPRPRSLSYFDRSGAIALSADGQTVLFGDAARQGLGNLYLRTIDGSPPRRLSGDFGLAMSPDGKSVLLAEPSEKSLECCLIVPTGPGQPKRLDPGGVRWMWTENRGSGFFPDGKSVYYVGREEGHRPRVWVQGVEGGKPRAATPEDVRRPVLVGDGRYLCARSPKSEWMLYPASGEGEPRPVAGIRPGEEPIQAAPDGLFVRGADELRPGETLITTRVYRVDPMTGRRELWKEIPPKDPRTGGAVTTILFSADGKTCVWTHMRYSTELVLAEGLK